MRSTAACFDELRSYLDEVPLVDCHDHNQENVHRYNDPIADARLSIEERWPLLEEVWKRTCHKRLTKTLCASAD